MATQIKLRRDTYQNWYDNNPVLALGEPAYDTTNNKLKIGNGTSAWRDLSYLTDATGGGTGDVTFDGSTLTTPIQVDILNQGIIRLAPGSTGTTQYLDYGQFLNVYPTNAQDAPHIHIDAGSGTFGKGDLILGDDNYNVDVNNQGYIGIKTYDRIRGNNSYWYFGTDGTLNGPAMGGVTIPALIGTPGNDLYLVGGGNTRNTRTLQFSDADGTEKSSYTVDTNTFGVSDIPPGATMWITANNTVGVVSVTLGEGTATIDFGVGIVLQAATDYTIDWYGTDQHNVVISTANTSWDFRSTGELRNGNSFTKTTSNTIVSGSSVIWTASEDYISGAKLLIQVEADETGDTTGWHSQVCEAVIASRGYANTYGGPGGTPVITVYGVTYTSTAPLATFTVQRNPTTKKIEVVGTSTAAASTPPNIRIYSVETATND